MTRSREDQAALHLLEIKTVCMVWTLEAKKEIVMPLLRSTEQCLFRELHKAAIYNAEIQ